MAHIALHHSSRPALAETFAAIARIIGTWRERSRERRELTLLDARSLRDLGLNPSNIAFEASKPFWRD
jgi:uncharacterized protein YjiS (DUF1127 family)